MVLTEVNLLTGFTLSGDYASVLVNEIGTVFKRQELSGNRLSIYLDGVCFYNFRTYLKYINNLLNNYCDNL